MSVGLSTSTRSLAHEIGHALGIGHSDTSPGLDIMDGYYGGELTAFSATDRSLVRTLYATQTQGTDNNAPETGVLAAVTLGVHAVTAEGGKMLSNLNFGVRILGPEISNVGPVVSYRENGAAALVAPAAVVKQGPIFTGFSGGRLTVVISGNAESTDRLGIRHVGNAAGQIGVSGTTVKYGGVAIGTFTGTTRLTITLNTAASPAAVQALLRNVTFATVSDTPSTLDRTVSIALTDRDGAISDTITTTVKVAAVNDAPVIGAFDTTINYTENTAPVLLDQNATVIDLDSANFSGGRLTVTVTENLQWTDRISIRHVGDAAGQIGVSGNTIRYGGVLIGLSSGLNQLIVNFHSTATPAAVQALLRNLTFSSVTRNPSALTRKVRVTLNDGDGGTSQSVTKSVQVKAINDAPMISAFETAVRYRENDPPVVLDTDATITDWDSSDFSGGKLAVEVAVNAQATDRLGILNAGNAAGQISLSGTTVRYGGVVIGTYSGTTKLVVTLNSSATMSAVQALLRSITFSSTSDNPNVADRYIKASLTDGDGGTSRTATKLLRLTPVNDAATIAAGSGTVTYTEGTTPVLVASGATLTDVDSVNFSGGALTIFISANAQSTDRVGIRHVGNAAGQIGVSGSQIRYGGVLIGMFSQTGNFVINLTSAATPTAVQALLRNITFSCATANISLKTRTVTITLTEFDGTRSQVLAKEIRLRAAAETPVVAPPTFYRENSSAIVLDSKAVLTAGHLTNFGGGKLTVTITTNSESSDRVGIRHVGNATGQIGLSGTTIKYSGVVIGSFSGTTTLVVSFNSGATPAAVQALLRNITFSSVSENPSTLNRTLKISLQAANGTIAHQATKSVQVVALNDAPVIGAFDTTISYTENTAPVLLDLNATVLDLDSSDFSGGRLTVNLAENSQWTDRIGIRHVGDATGQIGVSGNTIRYGGVVIGLSSGLNQLIVNFHSTATPAAVQALLRNLTFSSVTRNPSALTRKVRVTLTDGDGGTSQSVTKSVQVRAINDAPIISAFETAVRYQENDPPIVLDTDATISDWDSSDFSGGKLTVEVAVNAQTTDRLGIRNAGNVAGKISVAGALVQYGGLVIGTYSGTTKLVVALNSHATARAVQELLRSITFSSSSNNPTVADRSIKASLTDGDGGTSLTVTKLLRLTAVNDVATLAGGSGIVTYTEGTAPVLVASGATLTDVDSVNFSGGALTIFISANAQSTDRVGIRHVGNAAGQIGVSGSQIRYGGVLIGMFSQTGNFVINLTSAATPTAVQALLRNITFSCVATNISLKTRTVTITLTEFDGTRTPMVMRDVRCVKPQAPGFASVISPGPVLDPVDQVFSLRLIEQDLLLAETALTATGMK
ncbi:MAG: hypothetical protein U0936_25115 [Planctomycetaceae bacterium]